MALCDGPPGKAAQGQARQYLEQQLQAVRSLTAALPAEPENLRNWLAGQAAFVGVTYQGYLRARQQGAARRYFHSMSQALYFLRNVAPTKLVDGAWLYGTLADWQVPGLRPLIDTYLEELGTGVPGKNHVLLYKKLLASHDCEDWTDLPDDRYVQGALQLALAYDARRYLPELAGYNLGYEQLPLHLLITAFELNELGIDPYYFTLHVTVDNISSGHAAKAVRAVRYLLAHCGAERGTVLRRVRDGYLLNELGASTTSVIIGFDLEAELTRVLAQKCVVGKNMHSDYCRIAGRSINEWLAEPSQVPALLAALQASGWVKRGLAAEESSFWRLIQSERADMFGVFSAYEQQVLRDWIATPVGAVAPVEGAHRLSHRARQRALDTLAGLHGAVAGKQGARGVIRHHPDQVRMHQQAIGDGASELRELERQVATADSKPAAMRLLLPLLGPALHHSAPGLMATRIFSRLLA